MNKVICIDNIDIYGKVIEELKIGDVYEVYDTFTVSGMPAVGKTKQFSFTRSLEIGAYIREWNYTTNNNNYYWLNSLNFNYDRKFFITLAEWREQQINSILND